MSTKTIIIIIWTMEFLLFVCLEELAAACCNHVFFSASRLGWSGVRSSCFVDGMCVVGDERVSKGSLLYDLQLTPLKAEGIPIRPQHNGVAFCWNFGGDFSESLQQ